MTPSKPATDPILRYGAIGFFTIIALCWVVETIHLPHLLFGEPAKFVWPRVLFRTALIGGIWAWVHFTTSRLLARLRQLEKYLRLCSWCRKIDHEGEWLSTEDYFGSRFETETSHGICPACAHEQFPQLDASTRGPAPRDRGNTFSDS
jgi:hypothetical protein